MDVLNFLKFWRHATITTTYSKVPSQLEDKMDNGSDEEDSFFVLELCDQNSQHKENNNNYRKEDKNIRESKGQEGLCKMANKGGDSEVNISKTTHSLSSTDPISKRRILPIEPISKAQSPISLLKSAPGFRMSIFKKSNILAAKNTEESDWDMKTQMHKQQKKQTKVFALKLGIDESHNLPSLRRAYSSRSYRSKFRSQSSEEAKPERFSKDVLQKYLKLIKPPYVRFSKKYSERMMFSGELSSTLPKSSPLVTSVSSSRKEKPGNFPAGIRDVCQNLVKSRSTSAATGFAYPESRSDDTLLQQHDGIQSAIQHCKRSFNFKDSVRKSFEEENAGSTVSQL